MMLPPNILGICLCAIVLTCKLPAGQLSSVDNPFCPREGYAVSDVSITPGDNIFIKCEQLMSEFQKNQNCTDTDWSSLATTSFHYCAPGSYLANYRQKYVMDNSTPDYKMSASCCVSNSLCTKPACIFPRQPINECNMLGDFKVNQTSAYIGAIASAYCKLSKVRSYRVQYCSCILTEAELESQLHYSRKGPYNVESNGQSSNAGLEQSGGQSNRGDGLGTALALGLGLPLALGLAFGLSPKNCNVTALPNGVVAGNFSGKGGYIFKSGQCGLFACDSGYIPEGTFEICCNRKALNGTKPTCTPASCYLSFPNGRVTGNVTANGQLITMASGLCSMFTCTAGFDPEQHQEICCNLGRIDNPVPVCTPQSCHVGAFSNGTVAGQFSGTLDTDIVITNGQCGTFACKLGFYPTSQVRICCAEGQSTAAPPVCLEPLSCQANSFPNGTVTGTTITFSGAPDTGVTIFSGRCATFTCFLGYEPKAPSAVCCNNGTSAGVIPYCSKSESCTIGQWNTTAGNITGNYTLSSSGEIVITSGNCVTFTCGANFFPTGPLISCCFNGTISNNVPVCTTKNACIVSSYVNGKVSGKYQESSTSIVVLNGDCVTFQCNTDYKPADQFYSCCNENKLTSPVPYCYSETSCSVSFPNGIVTGQSIASTGTTYALASNKCATFQCSRGYSPTTIASTCCQNGGLTNVVPTCTADVSCSYGSFVNGQVSGSVNSAAATVLSGGCASFQCADGYLPNDVYTVCCNDGILSGPIPYCTNTVVACLVSVPYDATGPTSIPSGAGTDCTTYSCKCGYEGSSTNLCCKYGSIIGEFPRCKQRVCLVAASATGDYTGPSQINAGESAIYTCNCGMYSAYDDTTTEITVNCICATATLNRNPNCAPKQCTFTYRLSAASFPANSRTEKIDGSTCLSPRTSLALDSGVVGYFTCKLGQAQIDTSFTSGCAGFSRYLARYSPGNDLVAVFQTDNTNLIWNSLECTSLCTQNPRCISVDFSSGQCWLKYSSDAGLFNLGTDRYVKTC